MIGARSVSTWRRRGLGSSTSVTQRRREEIDEILRAMPTSERGNLVRAFEAFGRAAGEIPDEEWQRSWDL